MTNIKNEIQEAERIYSYMKESIMNKILSLPQNKKIKVLSQSPRCFVIQRKDLGSSNLSVEYHDFVCQYEMIAFAINNKKPESLSSFVESIIESGRIEYKMATYNLHPQVIEYIKELYYGKD